MARMPLTGASFASLFERTTALDEAIKTGLIPDLGPMTTLPEVLADLGLAPLSNEDEKRVRNSLGRAIALGYEDAEYSHKRNPQARLRVTDVKATLIKVADNLDVLRAGELGADQAAGLEKVLHGACTGLRESHDSAAAQRIIEVLRREIGYEKAYERVTEFRKWPRTVAEACRRAAAELGAIKRNPGRRRLDWYEEFVRVLRFIAEKNGIRPTISKRFIDLAERFQLLLPPHMRSPSREAIAQRIKRLRGGD